MKLVIVLLLLSTSVFADSWKQMSSTTESAKNGKEFTALQAKYPEMLGFGDARKVVKASVTSTTWKYTGPNSCQENDLRLMYTGHGMSYCDKQGSAVVCSSSTAMPPMGNYDPCQFGQVESLMGPGWTMIEEGHEEATTHGSISYLMERYAKEFARYRYSDSISRVSIDSYGWYYFGQNVCMGDDPRLNPVFYKTEVCTMKGMNESCEVTEAKRPEVNADPCL